MNGNEPTLFHGWAGKAAAILLLAAGIVHLVIVPHHLEHAPAHGIFMAAIGVVEILWAAAFWIRPSNRLVQAGIVLTIGCIILWGITRVYPAPFGHGPEEVDAAGILSKILEGLAALALVRLLLQPAPQPKRPYAVLRSLVPVILVAVILAFGVYEAARASEPLFPQLAAPEMHDL